MAAVAIGASSTGGLLGYLLLHRRQVASSDRLVRALWGDAGPVTARAQVHSAMWHLRQALRGSKLDDRLESQAGGYRFDVSDDEVDAGVFAARAAQARMAAKDGRLATAAELFASAEKLWRGEAMGGAAGDYVAHARARLDEERLAAREDHAEVRLRLGQHSQMVGELDALIADHPTRQRLTGLAMLALHRCGRPAEAAQAYRRLRERLADELGLDPSRELQELHAAVLRDDPALAASPSRDTVTATAEPAGRGYPIPAQVPRVPGGFVGRHDDLATLNAYDELGALVILTGTPGVGKTALAVQWAHSALPRFPDGQLYLNLRGFAAARPVAPVEALAQFLRGLGMAAGRIPADTDEAAALYRSALAGRRVLIVLDNAADAAQVRPLLPGSPDGMVLITSRNRLDGLVAHEGAHRLTLRALSTVDAVTLLEQMIGGDRVSAEADAATALTESCGGLPLALRIAGTHLAANPGLTVGKYLTQLRGDQTLAAFALPDDEVGGVRAAFDLSYSKIDALAQRLFRLLGVVPGPDFAPDATAVLIDAPVSQVRQLLDRLTTAHLVDLLPPGRFHLHDLLRQYAQELVTDDVERHEARARLFRWYLASAQAAHATIKTAPPPPVAQDGTVESSRSFADAAEARAWQDEERANLVAIVLEAAEHGPRRLAVHLARTLIDLFARGGWSGQWLTMAGAALAAAKADGDPADLADAHLDLATACHVAGLREQAAQENGAALAVARRHGVRKIEALAIGNLGIHEHEQGRITEAVAHFEELMRLSAEVDFPYGQAIALNNLGFLYHHMGRLDDAGSHLRSALAHPIAKQRLPFRANTLTSLASVERDAGYLDDALEHGNAALAAARDCRDRRAEAAALAALATIHSARGQHRHGIDLGEQALNLARDGGQRETEAEVHIGLCSAHRGQEELAAALDCAQHGVDLAREIGSGPLEGQALTELAATHLAMGDAQAAIRAAQHAHTLLEQPGHGLARDRAAAMLARARSA